MTDLEDYRVMEAFYQRFSEKYPYITHENLLKLKDITAVKRLEKGEVFLNQGDVLTVGVFVVSGWLRVFYFDEKGNERISMFRSTLEYIDNWNSIHRQEPLPYSISAITQTTIVLYPLKKMIEMFTGEPLLLQLCIDLSQEMIKAKQQHYEILTFRSPEERYLHLLKTQKRLLKEISVTDLAKYLHVSREALSRARSQVTLRKIIT